MQCPRALSRCSVVFLYRDDQINQPQQTPLVIINMSLSTAAWPLAVEHVRPRRCRQLLQLHPAACTAASSTEMGASVPPRSLFQLSHALFVLSMPFSVSSPTFHDAARMGISAGRGGQIRSGARVTRCHSAHSAVHVVHVEVF